MTSQINLTTINPAYPIAGINQSSQGFRDNFSAIKSGLTVASTEITNLHNKTITFDAAGDFIGTSDPFGPGSTSVNFMATLKTVGPGPGTYNGAIDDIEFSIDDKGRIVAVTTTSAPGPSATGIFGPQITGLGNLGNGSGTISFPTVRYDAKGRASETSGSVAYSYGLFGHTMPKGSLLGGVDGLTGTSAIIPPPPSFTDPYFLGVDPSTPSGLKWSQIVIPTGTISTVTSEDGISAVTTGQDVLISLDTASLPAFTFSSLNLVDQIIVYNASSANPAHYSLTWNEILNGFDLRYLANVVEDTSPELGGDLETNGFDIVSNSDLTISASGAGDTLSLTGDTLDLSGISRLLINSLQWPNADGTAGQQLVTNGSGVLGWATSSLIVPRTLFVVEAAFGGSDGPDGTGSLDHPFATIGKALSVVPNNSTDMWTIMIIGGSYAEDITINGKRNLTIEGFFYGNKPKLTGLINIESGVSISNWQNLVVDSTARDISDAAPGLAMTSGCDEANFNNCDFLRGVGAASELNMILLLGSHTGNITFENSIIQGDLTNALTSVNGAQVIINNPRSSAGFFSITTQGGSNTRIAGATHIKGINHVGGILELENLSSVEAEEYTLTTSQPSIPQLTATNDLDDWFLADGTTPAPIAPANGSFDALVGPIEGTTNGAQAFSKTFSLTNPNTPITIDFDFNKIDSWDYVSGGISPAINGPESLFVYVNNEEIFRFLPSNSSPGDPPFVFNGTFSTVGSSGTYVITAPGGDPVDLGYSATYNDRIYHVKITFSTILTSIKLGFGNNNDEPAINESLGINHVRLNQSQSLPYYRDPLLELDLDGNPIPILVVDEDPLSVTFGQLIPGERPVLDNDRNIVYELDSNGDPIQEIDGNGDPVYEADGITPVYIPVMTSFVQFEEQVPSVNVIVNAGINSTADSSVGNESSLILRNVNMWHEDSYAAILKRGNCPWKFENVSRRSDLDTVNGPRIAFDINPDEAQFMSYYVANGVNLRFADDNSIVPDNKVDLQLGRSFQVTLVNNSTVTLKTPVATEFNPGPLVNSGEFYAEVMVAVKQDSSGNHTVTFAEDSGTGITWLGGTAVNASSNSFTFYQFRYFSRLRKWIGQKQADGQSLKITPTSSVNYTLQPSDANAYVRRANNLANLVTVPSVSTVQYPIGTQIHVVQSGIGTTTIQGAPGVVINTPETYSLIKRFSKATLTKIANNSWDLSGDLEPGTVTPSITVDNATIQIADPGIYASG